jgi:hypothetical protein
MAAMATAVDAAGATDRLHLAHWNRQTFDFSSISANATGVEVFRLPVRKAYIFQLATNSAPDWRSHEVQRMPRRRERFWLLPAGGSAQPIAQTPLKTREIHPQPDGENAFARAIGGGSTTGIEPSPTIMPSRVIWATGANENSKLNSDHPPQMRAQHQFLFQCEDA